MFQTAQKLSQGDTTVHRQKVVSKWHHSCQKVVLSCSKWCPESIKIKEHKCSDHSYNSSINSFFIIILAILDEGISGKIWYSSFSTIWILGPIHVNVYSMYRWLVRLPFNGEIGAQHVTTLWKSIHNNVVFRSN